MKYYLFGSKLPAVEIDIAKMIGADLAFCRNGDAVTVVYAVSDLGVQELSEVTIRRTDSALSNPAFLIFRGQSETAGFLKDAYGWEMEQVMEHKTSQ